MRTIELKVNVNEDIFDLAVKAYNALFYYSFDRDYVIKNSLIQIAEYYGLNEAQREYLEEFFNWDLEGVFYNIYRATFDTVAINVKPEVIELSAKMLVFFCEQCFCAAALN